MLSVDTKALNAFLTDADFAAILPELSAAHDALRTGTCRGNDFLGWLTWPETYDREEFARIRKAAEAIREQSEVLIVVGIGGSYLGARAVLELLKSPFHNQLPQKTIEVYFTGNNLSASYMKQVLAVVGQRDFSVNVISKSGTTTEPAVAFRLWRELLVKKYGRDGAAQRIYATTDKSRGALKTLADREGYQTFVIPDDIGGRFSVLTAVGLLPLAAAGIDTEGLMRGAREAMSALDARSLDNPAWRYAAARNLLYRKGFTTEVLACYEPAFRFMAEWWKQLYGESEGKEHKGIFPASVDLTADLHSMGQYLQEGVRNLFETVVTADTPPDTLTIPDDPDNADGLNFLSGLDVSSVNREAMRGTVAAHTDGGVPCLRIRTEAFDEASVGQLIYFFELACGLSGQLLGVNPFDQPGVEAYKKNMFALLNKPGFEEQGQALQDRLTGLGL